ncbi:MAG: hypothetical protein AAF569_01310 [Pseudomonadota bacterium]
MSIELAQLRHGGIALLTDDDLPDKIGAIEFFKEERQIQISYENEKLCGRLVEEILPENAVTAIESSPESVMVFHIQGEETIKYEVPLHRIID